MRNFRRYDGYLTNHRDKSEQGRAECGCFLALPHYPLTATASFAREPALDSKIVGIRQRNVGVVFWKNLVLALDGPCDLRAFVVKPLDQRVAARPIPLPLRTKADSGIPHVEL